MSANQDTELMTVPTQAGDPIDLRAVSEQSEVTIYDPEELDNGNYGAWITAKKKWVGDRVRCR
jgi:hypothetical protein